MFYICHGTYLLFQNYGEFLSKGLDDKNNERCKGKKIEKDLYTFEDIVCIGEKKMEEVKQEIGQDLTEEVRKVTKSIYRFPKNLEILEAKLLAGRYLYIEYEFDRIIYKKEIPVYTNLGSLIVDTVFKILVHYISMHLEQ